MIDRHHPRATSLLLREKIVKGVQDCITSLSGLTAHGRGEAFDYLIGEKTHPFAMEAIEAAAATLLLAQHPILSINGNVAALCAKDMIRLAEAIPAHIEVNLFHYTTDRVQKIERYLQEKDQLLFGTTKHILLHQKAQKVTLPHIASDRKITLHDGIATADVVFVPLEDGDRAQALVEMGKTVITIDLNPLSRTAKAANITIVDHICRCLPLLTDHIKHMKSYEREKLSKLIDSYNQKKILILAEKAIRS